MRQLLLTAIFISVSIQGIAFAGETILSAEDFLYYSDVVNHTLYDEVDTAIKEDLVKKSKGVVEYLNHQYSTDEFDYQFDIQNSEDRLIYEKGLANISRVSGGRYGACFVSYNEKTRGLSEISKIENQMKDVPRRDFKNKTELLEKIEKICGTSHYDYTLLDSYEKIGDKEKLTLKFIKILVSDKVYYDYEEGVNNRFTNNYFEFLASTEFTTENIYLDKGRVKKISNIIRQKYSHIYDSKLPYYKDSYAALDAVRSIKNISKLLVKFDLEDELQDFAKATTYDDEIRRVVCLGDKSEGGLVHKMLGVVCGEQ